MLVFYATSKKGEVNVRPSMKSEYPLYRHLCGYKMPKTLPKMFYLLTFLRFFTFLIIQHFGLRGFLECCPNKLFPQENPGPLGTEIGYQMSWKKACFIPFMRLFIYFVYIIRYFTTAVNGEKTIHGGKAICATLFHMKWA